MDFVNRTNPKIYIQRVIAVFEMLSLSVLSIAIGATGTILFLRVTESRVEPISFSASLIALLLLILVVSAIILSVLVIFLCRLAGRARESAVRRMDAAIHLAGIEMTRAVCSKVDELRGGPPVPRAVRADDPAGSVNGVIGYTVRHAIETAEKKYNQFRDIILLGAENYPGVVCLKNGEGLYDTDGDQLVDGSFIMNRERVAICTFCTDEILADRFLGEGGERFSRLIGALFHELHDGHFTRVFMVFDSIIRSDSLYAKRFGDFRQKIGEAIFDRFELFEGDPGVIIPKLTKRVGRLMA